MRRKSKLPELLAPAGSFEALVAAVEAGADAVYIGAKRFGARAYAKNFDTGEISRALSYCHLFGVRLYVTLNTLVTDREMDEALLLVAELYKMGVDALIVADLGLIREIRRRLPDFELHASTQMSVHNTEGADEAYRLGCVRVVPARELSKENIRAIIENSLAEVEVFLHGALCVSFSGQCLFSSLVGGRSGNRGECAQPCRLPYNGKYPLSLSDLSLAHHIPELIELGVCSLKIEGRMKSPSYVYTVTKIYRDLLDGGRCATESEAEQLRRAFSRGGFTDGYFTGKTSHGMTGVRSESDKRESREADTRVFEIKRRKVFAKVKIRLGEPSSMTLTDGERCVSALGDVASLAQTSPLTDEGVRQRLSKMGNSFLSLSQSDIDLTLDTGVNLPPSSINALRRRAQEAFEDFSREAPAVEKYTPDSVDSGAKRTAQFLSESAFGGLSDSERRRFDVAFIPVFSARENLLLSNGVYLPPVITDKERSQIQTALKKARDSGVKYALVGNIGHIAIARSAGLIPVGDYRLNITNSASLGVYLSLGLEFSVLSPELTLPQARDIGGSLTVYGRIPLMLTERCFISDSFGCRRCSGASLTDRRGEKFPIVREYPHRNLVLNSKITYMGDRSAELREFGIRGQHFIFTLESASEISAVLRTCERGQPLPLGVQIRRIGRR